MKPGKQLRIPFQLTPVETRCIRKAQDSFPFLAPTHYMSLIDPDDPADPLRRQIIPDPMESVIHAGESADVLDEQRYSPVPGLIHKYRSRVLILLTHRCAVHCRYCFRKNSPLVIPDPQQQQLKEVFQYIKKTTHIRETILSGGDPCVLSTGFLREVLDTLSRIPHIDIIRIHSRIPVVDPERITGELVSALRCEKPVWFVTHFNHPREICAQSSAACRRLLRAGIPVLNQSVLLKGINDDAKILASLSWKLIQSCVQPYYLHLLDAAPGTSHFHVEKSVGLKIVRELAGELPGYAVPRLVKDIPGRKAKTVVG